MDKIEFIIVLIFILVILYLTIFKENYQNQNQDQNQVQNQNQNKGIFNYFYQMCMNPYPKSMTKFFSNDISCNIK
jgi:uncharacterized membrane protein